MRLLLEWGLGLLTLVMGGATYYALTRPVNFETARPDPAVGGLLIADLALLLLLALLVSRRVTRLWIERRKGRIGSKLHLRLTGLFALFAGIPAIATALMSALFLQYGLQNWFSDTVRGTLDNSLEVAEAYVREHQSNIRLDLQAMAQDLNAAAADLERNRSLLQQVVEEQALFRSLQEAIVFDSHGRILAKFSFGLDLSTNRVPRELLVRAAEGEPVVIADSGDDQVRGLIRLRDFYDAFLYISHRIDPRVLAYVDAARSSVENYRSLEKQRASLQLRANAVFILLALVLILMAVWFGLWFADRLVEPLGRLVEAADRVRRGRHNVRVPGPAGNDEVGVLIRAFNRMARQIELQRRDLISANRELEERRHFLEAVLEGVSAGVLGVTPDGDIHLANQSAGDLLCLSSEEIIGRSVADIAPGMQALLERARGGCERLAQDHLEIRIDDRSRIFLVRVTSERLDDGSVQGYVVTFDDVTEQLRDQRTAAWADVARRIAHEIKNPLTPIQLSAERLRRKYLNEISGNREVFERCIDTIVRQVEDLRRMVDEFSSFARMPEPRFAPEDLREILRQTVFLQKMAGQAISYRLSMPDEPVMLECDGRLVAQALTNILKNAGEAIEAWEDPDRRDSAFIEIALTRDSDEIRIAIHDSGPGLPADTARLTEPYVTTRRKGTGLGLAIVRRVMEEHGGRIELSNHPEGGALVVMHFSQIALQRIVESRRNRRIAGSGKTAAAE